MVLRQLVPLISCTQLTYAVMEGVTVPIPSLEQLSLGTICLGPGISVSNGRVHVEDADGECQEDGCTSSANDGTLTQTKSGNACSDEVVGLREGDDGEVKGGEVVVQEELSLHEEERKPVESPAKDAGADLVVESLEGHVVVVLVSTLPSQNSQCLESQVHNNRDGRGPPDQRITDQVDLTVVLAPEVDTATKDWP